MIEENKKCPFNDYKECNEYECTFFNQYEYRCELKNKENKKNYISIGFKIAIGFWLFSLMVGAITYFVIITFFINTITK